MAHLPTTRTRTIVEVSQADQKTIREKYESTNKKQADQEQGRALGVRDIHGERRTAYETLREKWESVHKKLQKKVECGKNLVHAISLTRRLYEKKASVKDYFAPYWNRKVYLTMKRLIIVRQKLHNFQLDEKHASNHVSALLWNSSRVSSSPGMLIRLEGSVEIPYFPEGPEKHDVKADRLYEIALKKTLRKKRRERMYPSDSSTNEHRAPRAAAVKFLTKTLNFFDDL